MIMAITGPISSGKGKVAEMFRDKGFVHHSFSSEIRQVAKERGIEINRQNLSKLGHDLRKESPGKSIITAVRGTPVAGLEICRTASSPRLHLMSFGSA